MKKYYDKKHRRLVFINKKADSRFWDSHWSHISKDAVVKYVKVENRLVLNYTKKYLPIGSRILEGGCGRGQNVYTLSLNGYNAFGVDFAEETVSKINLAVPELKVTFGDVRKLDFDIGYFDGYWSLGVIEHFFSGYDEILNEMYRVIRKGGFLFLTVPSFSVLRKVKAALGAYLQFTDNIPLEDFYQFAYYPDDIIKKFTKKGFKIIRHKPLDGIKGLKDEIRFLYSPLQTIYDGQPIFLKVIRKSIDFVVRNLTNHISLFIFQKC